MSVRSLVLNPQPVAPETYETDEVTFSSLNAAGDYVLSVTVPLADAQDPAKGFSAELLWFDTVEQEWAGGGGMAQPSFDPDPRDKAGAPLPVKTLFTSRSTHQREVTDVLGASRMVVLDLMHGKRAKVRVVMPVFVPLTVSVNQRAVVDAQKADRVRGKPVSRA